ncbi:Peptidoglycan-binding (PGRP) domain of peptidoglycan hydrolases-containing protein [Stigmatella aurantiaca]|uniref:Peptidoglycan-binding (PGRP) domain of peptidoglycan hydrolases-containing protein n=1 Tax=Stigmatella aurantiaca TaxID=41 RepID=A0A1H7RE36_STIAU|nr:peptidoglycan-binding protein [Stigmatella aurantiaca]SEL58339.1 Peptidoglycan-binding (PGRP) domain of peptidoglycan hydrolases-containing protein [Stigmatella aurantiaca]
MRVSAAARSNLYAASAPSQPTLKLGSSGASVKNLQQALANAGFSPGAADGQFGPKTAAAVKAFQSARGLVADGVVGPKTWAKLTAAPSGGATPTLKQGATGASVTNLQNRLAQHGFNPGAADGQFGPKTTAAVKAFQSAKGLVADGVVGPKTWAKLNAAAAPSAPGGSGPTLKQGYSGAPVTALQNRLNQLGFNAGAADGQFGPKTTAAVKAFQSSKGLVADGVVGPKTWSQLGITVGGTPTVPSNPGGAHGNSALANNARNVALSMGGYSSQGLCATGVSRAIQNTYGIKVWGNGNQIDDNLPRNKFKQVNLSLAEALKIPGLVLTWEKTSTRLGSIYGHTAITSGDGRSSYSDFVESNTLAAGGRSGFKVFMPI